MNIKVMHMYMNKIAKKSNKTALPQVLVKIYR